MEQGERKVPSDSEIFQALSATKEKYEELFRIKDLIAEIESQNVQQIYHRDINHPLSIAIKE